MTEWEVVGVIVVLVGLAAAVIKPVVSLNSNITRLTELCGYLETNLNSLTAKNSQAHERLHRQVEEQESILQKHETRLAVLEKG